VTPRTRLLVYASPSNPLGWVTTEAEQIGLLEFARRHDLWLLADEVYDRLYYCGGDLGTPAPSILSRATRGDAVMVAQSFSKSYCMTGWRLGWLVAPGTWRNAPRSSTSSSSPMRPASSSARPRPPSPMERTRSAACWSSEGQPGLLPRALRQMPGVTVPSPTGRSMSFADRGAEGLVRVLPEAAPGDQGRDRAGRGLRHRRGGIGADLLCRRALHPRAGDGAAGSLPVHVVG